LGEKHGVATFRFLKNPIIRKYGEAFYNEMEVSEKILRQEGLIK